MKPKKIFFLCDASDIDIVEQSFAQTNQYELAIETTERIMEYGVRDYLLRTIELINKYPEMYDGIVGTHDSSAVFASIICEKTGKIFASVQSIINCQNKYISRKIQQKCLPEHVPGFCLGLDYLQNPEQLSVPLFIKPVRANISFGSHKISFPEELEHFIAQESKEIASQNQYFLDALSVDPEYQDQLNLRTCNQFLCEDLLTGDQVTIDGFVYNSEITVFGYTKAVFFPDSNSFSHHDFPYSFSPQLEDKIHAGLERLIPNLGINNSFFNVEIRVNENEQTFYILEVNSRIAFQFAKTIQAIRGFDPLHLLCQLSIGEKPDLLEIQETGKYKYCYNFELHTFADKKVIKTPTQSGYEEIKIHFPEVHVRNLIHENTKLSDYKHNPDSFRYCVLDIPGNSHQEIMEKYKQVTGLLNYQFEKIIDSY